MPFPALPGTFSAGLLFPFHGIQAIAGKRKAAKVPAPSAHRPAEASRRSLQPYAASTPLILFSMVKIYFRENHLNGSRQEGPRQVRRVPHDAAQQLGTPAARKNRRQVLLRGWVLSRDLLPQRRDELRSLHDGVVVEDGSENQSRDREHEQCDAPRAAHRAHILFALFGLAKMHVSSGRYWR